MTILVNICFGNNSVENAFLAATLPLCDFVQTHLLVDIKVLKETQNLSVYLYINFRYLFVVMFCFRQDVKINNVSCTENACILHQTKNHIST